MISSRHDTVVGARFQPIVASWSLLIRKWDWRDARPHPGPLPQERGEALTVPGIFTLFGVDLLHGTHVGCYSAGVQCAKFSLAANLTPNRTLSQRARRLREPMRHFDSALPKPVNRCNRWRLVASCRRLRKATTQRNSMRPFETLTEREILALAIALEEEDARIYD